MMRKISEVFNEMVGDDPTGFNVLTHIRVETTTDAYRVLSDGWSLTNYIKQHGDVEVEYDKEYDVYCVPAFEYLATCDNWRKEMGEGYYGVSDEFIMYVIVPCLIGLICVVKYLGENYYGD